MLELLMTVFFCWLFFKAAGLAFRMAWGTTKLIVSILFAIALPMVALGLLFAGSLMLLVPIALVGLAFRIIKFCD